MNAAAVMSEASSRCKAHVTQQVNRQISPFLGYRGPAESTPVEWNGGDSPILNSGSSE